MQNMQTQGKEIDILKMTNDIRKNQDIYNLYESYKKSLHNARKTVAKRQKLNADIRDECESPFGREDYNLNKNDITNWNSMIRDLEEDMKMMEMYLDFDDRTLLHRDYNNMKSMILNKNSYEGEIPLDDLYGESVSEPNIIYTNELREEIIEVISETLTERQQHVVDMLFWEGRTQQEAAEILGITQQGIADSLEKSLRKLKDVPKIQALFREFKEVCS